MSDHSNETLIRDAAPVLGSGNFLADRGYTDPEEARVKFQVANQIALLMEDHHIQQANICRATGLKQPDVSRIVNGNVSGFSVWRLLRALKSLGERVTISVEAPKADEGRTLAISL